jgi:hypothetical protein
LQAKDCLDSFFFYNEHTFVLFLEICGFNRARQRDKLGRLLDNFANLQDEVIEWKNCKIFAFDFRKKMNKGRMKEKKLKKHFLMLI